jgi:hypothetical protein
MFKRILSFSSILLLASTLSAENTPDTKRTMVVSVSPLAPVMGTLDAMFQYNVLDFLTVTVPGIFSYDWVLGSAVKLFGKASDGQIKITKAPIKVGGGLGARFYPSAKGMTDGFYLEPRFSVLYKQFGAEISSLGKAEWSAVSIIPTLNLGGDWFFDSGFYITFGTGLGYSYDVKQDFKITAAKSDLKDALSVLGWFLPSTVPSSTSKGRFVWDLDFKLGYAW